MGCTLVSLDPLPPSPPPLSSSDILHLPLHLSPSYTRTPFAPLPPTSPSSPDSLPPLSPVPSPLNTPLPLIPSLPVTLPPPILPPLNTPLPLIPSLSVLFLLLILFLHFLFLHFVPCTAFFTKLDSFIIHSFIPAISIAPLQVLYYSEALPNTARILYRSFKP